MRAEGTPLSDVVAICCSVSPTRRHGFAHPHPTLRSFVAYVGLLGYHASGTGRNRQNSTYSDAFSAAESCFYSTFACIDKRKETRCMAQIVGSWVNFSWPLRAEAAEANSPSLGKGWPKAGVGRLQRPSGRCLSQGILVLILLPRPSGTPSKIEGELAAPARRCRGRKSYSNRRSCLPFRLVETHLSTKKTQQS